MQPNHHFAHDENCEKARVDWPLVLAWVAIAELVIAFWVAVVLLFF